MEEIEVLVPVSQVEYGEIEMVGRPRDLDGKLIGFLWNHKPNGDLLLKGLEAALRGKFNLSGTLMREKNVASSEAGTEVLEELSAKCDLVILAIGD
jgi:hypothetical protein